MSQDKEFAQKFQDLLEQNVNVQSQQVQNGQRRESSNQRALTLQNMNSLALFPRHSIQKGIPLSKNMLSEDMYMKEYSSQEEESYEDKQRQKLQYKQENLIIPEDQQQWLVDELDLPKAFKKRRFAENTKNVLRNFGNAQNQYALYNKGAIHIVQQQISNPQLFYKWVRQLKLENFDGFKKVWGQVPSNIKIFQRVYKKICWNFFTQAAIPYVLSSRMRDSKTKISHLKYIYRFLEGLQNPQDFSYFKKLEK